MAVLVNADVVHGSADAREVTEGRTLLAAGGVGEVWEDAEGGVSGWVQGEDGQARDVWVRVVDRQLTADCVGPCGSTERGELCRHAVALGLQAVTDGLEWHEGEEREKQPEADAPADVLDVLRSQEAADVLTQLLISHPELHLEAEELARRALTPDSGKELAALQARTADEVESALAEPDGDALSSGHLSGTRDAAGAAAARRSISRLLEPYEQDVRRRAALGLTDAAEAVGLGVLDGLEACEGEFESDEVLHHAGEDLVEKYGQTVRELLSQAGRAVD